MSPDGTSLAHGLGGADDLPIPAELAIAGAVAALTISFVVLALAWRSPRYDPPRPGRPAPGWLDGLVASSAFRAVLRVLGLVVTAYAAAAAVLGENLLTNPFLGMFYVWLWVGLVPASLLLGPVWKALSPVRTINLALARIAGSDPDEGVLTYPERLGYWPAALGLYAFVWLELVHPDQTELGAVRLWCAVYLAVMLIGGAVYGSRFYERADPFEVFSTLVAKMSVWARSGGRLTVRSPLANLATVEVRPGLTAVVAILFGSTAFDSFRSSGFWIRYLQNSPTMQQHSWADDLADNLALLAFCVGVGLVLALGTMATGAPRSEGAVPRRALPDLLAHSIVPIIVGYFVAHYLSYFVERSQITLRDASDPFSTGADYLGTADLAVSYWLSYHPTFLAVVKVLAVVVGHVLGVVAAHDRAIRLLPPRHQLTGQLALLVAMVGFTAGGLYLLFVA